MHDSAISMNLSSPYVTYVAFVLSAMGANLVWPIALYSARTFTRVRGSVPGILAASAEARTSTRQCAPAQS